MRHSPVNGHAADGTTASQEFGLISQCPVFLGISPADCKKILDLAIERKFSRGQNVFMAGEPIERIVLLASGSVKETQFSQNGSEVILRVNAPGELVGPLGYSPEGHHSSAQALQLSRTLVWDSTTFESTSERFPILRRNTNRLLGERLANLEKRFQEISTKNAPSRVSSELLRLLSQIDQRATGEVPIRLSREELGQLTGTTLFTVSRLLSRWEQQGIVTASRKAVLVRDLPALIHVSEGE